MIDEKFIEEIRSIWEEWKEAGEKLNRIKNGRQFNKIDISSVYGALTAIGISSDAKLFAIVYIFTPEVLAGIKMRKGYRTFISYLFNYNNGCNLSNRLRNLLFTYKNYKEFRAEADRGVTVAENVLKNIKK